MTAREDPDYMLFQREQIHQRQADRLNNPTALVNRRSSFNSPLLGGRMSPSITSAASSPLVQASREVSEPAKPAATPVPSRTIVASGIQIDDSDYESLLREHPPAGVNDYNTMVLSTGGAGVKPSVSISSSSSAPAAQLTDRPSAITTASNPPVTNQGLSSTNITPTDPSVTSLALKQASSATNEVANNFQSKDNECEEQDDQVNLTASVNANRLSGPRVRLRAAGLRFESGDMDMDIKTTLLARGYEV
jgi:hypothetical protein